MHVSAESSRLRPELRYVASVALQLDNAESVGGTPDGVRMTFAVHGTVEGPELKGEFRKGLTMAFLRVDTEGVGTIHVRAPLFLHDGARAELVATGRYDFGSDGYQLALGGKLRDSDLGWCPRLVTDDERYLWLNRTQFLGIGRLRFQRSTVDYDLFAMGPGLGQARPLTATSSASLYERLGRREGIYRIMSVSIDSLHGHEQLNRQNPKLAALSATTNPADLKQKVTDFFCQLTGGPCVYRGRTMRESHGPLGITDADWALFIEDTRRVMAELDVPSREQGELVGLMESLKAEIVSSPRR